VSENNVILSKKYSGKNVKDNTIK